HFRDRFYMEVQPHAIPEQRKLNDVCAHFAKSKGLPLVATTDCHYASKDDHYAQEVLMCVSTGKQITDPDRLRHVGVDLHLKSYDEMVEGFGDWTPGKEAIENSLLIADACNLKFDFSKYYMPQFKTGDEQPLIDLMAGKAREGLERRLEVLEKAPAWKPEMRKGYLDRLELEIKLIDKMGFAGYFLVVADFIVWAKENGVPVGPGRGSAAGSLVAFALRITEVDPIRHKLLFERFLNPERISLPDIDVDFCINGRDRVIKYVVDKYGKENVAQIATFGTLKAKAAIKDVGRALGMSYAETDRVAQLIPAPRQGFDYSIAEALTMEKRLADYAKAEGKDLITLAMKLEGLTRHSSTHAAGVVIGDRPLIDMLPMMVDKDGNDVTQYSMTYVEKIGLVKFDFLGLKTLTVIHTALKIIKESRGIDIVLEELPLEDPKTYALLASGNTTGVFQLESTGITEMTMRLKPNSFDDVVAILALYRPGPLDAGMVDRYIERKHGREPVTYLHPLMKNTLSDTYGIILYQEQIMQLARELAGYSLAEADILRKAMGKKNPEEMAKQRERFLKGADDKKIDKKLAAEIFDQMETFARYGFNRSHSAAYALVSFQTAYLKTHYGVEFMAALMSHEMGDSDKTLKNLNECRKQHIEVLPPDVNASMAGFSVLNGKIHYGLSAVSGIGDKAVESIVAAREKGPFVDLEDFVARVDLKAVNRRVVESLIKCGAFDASKITRREMMERLEDVLRFGQSLQRDQDTNQMSLFGGGATQAPSIPRKSTNRPEWPVNQKLTFEREALGTYISGHPLEKFKKDLKRLGLIHTVDVRSKGRATEVRVGGVVTALKLKNTKKGDRYASFVLEDYLGTIECLVWPDVYRNVAQILAADDPVICIGRPDVSEERCTLIVNKLDSLTGLRDRSATQGLLVLAENDKLEERLDPLLTLFRRHAGNCPIKVKLEIEGAEVSVALKDRGQSAVSVVPSEALCDEVEQIFGRPVLSFV
ncbi:MAG: DNA polymerase III subunit alpha, partial [Deltaproteobacteria bacterium]|nr:DNA polymerase III subunit alpha [Deltaproteobacteria bacterium]